MTAIPRGIGVLFRSVAYAVRGGFLVRPFTIALTLGIAGMVLSRLERQVPGIGAPVTGLVFPSRADPETVEAILTGIATSVMTVVSIVFAILLMTLTLASTQFSPRILISFTRDQVTQWTLGIFLGTFSYCIAVLPAVQTTPPVFVPVATVVGAMGLAPICVGLLIYFIYHISNAISVNNIVDRIRRETELVIDQLMPQPRREFQIYRTDSVHDETLPFVVASRQSGYIRFIDIARLRPLARSYHVRMRLERRVGHFIPKGVALLRLSRGDGMTEERVVQLLACIEIGPTRTMQQDVEFGVVQIVDIALRALSPAVNDPTTAISCVDQLSCILIRWIGRVPPPDSYYDPPHVLRLSVPWIGFDGLLDLAFEQIRHYAISDAAVSLRLMRALGDIGSTVHDTALRRELVARGQRVTAGCAGRLQEGDFKRLQSRLALLEAGMAEEEE